MGSDTTRAAKAVVRGLIGLVVGFLVGTTYYNNSVDTDAALPWAIAMGFVAAVVIFFLLSAMGKSSD